MNKPATTVLERCIPSFQSSRPGQIFALVVVPNDYKIPEWSVGIAVLGEPGYTAVSPKLGAESTYEAMAARVDAANARLGYTPDTLTAIIADTMRRSTFKQDQEARLTTIKVNESELKLLSLLVSEAEDDAPADTPTEQEQELLRKIDEALKELDN